MWVSRLNLLGLSEKNQKKADYSSGKFTFETVVSVAKTNWKRGDISPKDSVCMFLLPSTCQFSC